MTCFASLVTVPQTKVSYFQQADPKGLVPKFLVNSKIVVQLALLSDMRKKFDKSLEIDQARRAELVPKIEQLPVGEGAGAVEARFVELFAEREGSEEVKLKLLLAGSARWPREVLHLELEVLVENGVPVVLDSARDALRPLAVPEVNLDDADGVGGAVRVGGPELARLYDVDADQPRARGRRG